jgi:Family of unknown function (DUF5343)
MGVPTSYLMTTKNLAKILATIQNAQAPKQFTTRFLATLGFPSAGDRLIIGVLKSIGFLTAEGSPTKRYFEYLDQTQSKRVLAEGIREAYADLFQINRKANELSNGEIKNKLKTITQGQVSDSVLDKMAMTLKALAQHADFVTTPSAEKEATKIENPPAADDLDSTPTGRINLGGLVYNIQLILPADRDQAVYDALFRSLKEHLLK